MPNAEQGVQNAEVKSGLPGFVRARGIRPGIHAEFFLDATKEAI